ncbi:MAG: adenosine kinase [Gammaproteobacteria bacterium]|nr:adenosine kinase [Pseudomonadota bacterium]MCZ6537769.1 adenosine kinase [Gammaproteobacteria bacterium]
MTSPVTVLGISNAIVDVLAHVDDKILAEIGSIKGSMTLIDQDQAERIYDLMGPTTEMSGGSVANTIANLATLGGQSAYIGCVADDRLGQVFVRDMKSLGVDVILPPVNTDASTASSYILISPGGERTLNTYLGACLELSPTHVSEDAVAGAGLVLLEGYIWDNPHGPAAADKAMRLAKESGAKIGLTLSDSYCVDRHRAAFAEAIDGRVQMVFANEKEIMSLLGTRTFEDAVAKTHELEPLFVLTRSEKGSVIVNNQCEVIQAAVPVDEVVDVTGAGDAYIAGFLYGWTAGLGLDESASLGSACAARVIQQIGSRLEKSSQLA